MYWWNASKLADDLREGRVDEKERFKYFLGTIVLWIWASQLIFHFGSPFKIGYLIASAVNLILVIVGIALCYRANSRRDNKDFISRMVCLALPIGIQLGLIFSAICLFASFLGSLVSALSGPASHLPKLQEVMAYLLNSLPIGGVEMGPLLVPAYCLSLNSYLTRVSQPIEDASAIKTKQTDWWLGCSVSDETAWLLAFVFAVAFMVVDLIRRVWISSLGLPEPLDHYVECILFTAIGASLILLGSWLEKQERG